MCDHVRTLTLPPMADAVFHMVCWDCEARIKEHFAEEPVVKRARISIDLTLDDSSEND